jgi:hypothetical protein
MQIFSTEGKNYSAVGTALKLTSGSTAIIKLCMSAVNNSLYSLIQTAVIFVR